MSYISLINALETAVKAEDISINFYSKLSRRIGRMHPLYLQLERFAKEKVIFKKYFTDLLYIIKNKGIIIINTGLPNFKNNNIEKYFDLIEVVGDHSNLNSLFENAVKYQIEIIKYYFDIRASLNTESPELNKIIIANKEFTAILNQYVDFKSDDYIQY